MTTIFQEGLGGMTGGGGSTPDAGGVVAPLVAALGGAGGNGARTTATADRTAQANVPTGAPDGTPLGTTTTGSRRKRKQRDTILTGVEEATGTVRTAAITGV